MSSASCPSWGIGVVDTFRIPTLVASAGVAFLSLWVLWLRPRDRVHRALALFLVFRALLYGLLPFVERGADLPSSLSVYAAIAIPFAGLNFAAVFWDRYSSPSRGPQPRQVTAFRWALLVAAVAFEVVYLLDHGLWFAPQPEAPLILFQPLTYVSYAVVAAVLLWAYTDPGAEIDRRGLFLLGTAFALEPAYWGTFATLQLGIRTSEGAILAAHDLLYAASFVLLAASVAALAWRSRQRQARSVTTRYGIALLLPAVSGAVVYGLEGSVEASTFLTALFLGDAFWHLALVIVAVYALLRYEMFGLEPQVKFAVERGTMGAALGLALFGLSESLEVLVPVEGTWMGFLAAGLITIALHPFERLGETVADQLMPRVDEDPAYEERRRREIYRMALEGMIDDEGDVDLEAAEVLGALREDLDIDDATHEELVVELDVEEGRGLSLNL